MSVIVPSFNLMLYYNKIVTCASASDKKWFMGAALALLLIGYDYSFVSKPSGHVAAL